MEEKVKIGKEILDASHVVKRYLDRTVCENGISGIQGRILGFLSEETGQRDIFQRDIEECFHIRRSSVTSVISLMEKNGYLNRISVPEDARLRKIVLTQKGREMNLSIKQSLAAMEKKLAAPLTDGEVMLLKELLHKVTVPIMD